GHTGYKVPEVKLDTAEGVLAALGSPCLATRALAINRLKELPPRELTAALSAGYLQIDSPELRVRSSWCFAFGGTFDDTLLKSIPLIMQSDARLRAKNIRSIERALPKMVQGFGAEDAQALVGVELAKELRLEEARKAADTAVFREILLVMRHARPESCRDSFYTLAKKYKGNDHFYLAAFNIACGTDPARRDAILADFDKHFPEWNDTVADLVWELRPKSVLPRMEQLLVDPKLTGPQKARIV